ncbi:MAG TPA: LysM domain-containing protein [Rubrivivax sp.]|nr:LysM domain-containing protein [Rubrivivax sp.]
MAELQRVLQADPQHRLAQSLVRQIKEDPQVLLGREWFSYQVKSGESLSSIAQRFMRDVYLFYSLARYNDIKVPRQLAGGQIIRVPGKAPLPGPAPGPGAPPVAATTTAPVPPVAAPAPQPPPAPAPAPVATPQPMPAPAPPPPVVTAPAESRQSQIERLQRQARSAFAKQDLAGAIAAWDKVLAIDPDNRTAQLERQKAVDLCKKLNAVTQGAKPAC